MGSGSSRRWSAEALRRPVPLALTEPFQFAPCVGGRRAGTTQIDMRLGIEGDLQRCTQV